MSATAALYTSCSCAVVYDGTLNVLYSSSVHSIVILISVDPRIIRRHGYIEMHKFLCQIGGTYMHYILSGGCNYRKLARGGLLLLQ